MTFETFNQSYDKIWCEQQKDKHEDKYKYTSREHPQGAIRNLTIGYDHTLCCLFVYLYIWYFLPSMALGKAAKATLGKRHC